MNPLVRSSSTVSPLSPQPNSRRSGWRRGTRGLIVAVVCAYVGWGFVRSQQETVLGIADFTWQQENPMFGLTIKFGWPLLYVERMASANAPALLPFPGDVQRLPYLLDATMGIVLILTSGLAVWRLTGSSWRWSLAQWIWLITVAAIHFSWWRWEHTAYLRILPTSGGPDWSVFADAFTRYGNSPMLRAMKLPLAAIVAILFASCAFLYQLPDLAWLLRGVRRNIFVRPITAMRSGAQ